MIKLVLGALCTVIRNVNQEHLINSNNIINETIIALNSKYNAVGAYKEMIEALKQKKSGDLQSMFESFLLHL